MNLWDVCKSIINGCANGIKLLWSLLAAMLRLTYRKWWLVLVFIIAGASAAMYYTRKSNLRYKVSAIVCLNGPTINEVQQRFEALNQNFSADVISSQNKGAMLGISPEKAAALSRFRTFRIIDCMHNGTADYIDWKGRNSGTDTLNVRMEDRLALQFQTKDPENLPEVAEAIITYMNNSQLLQASFSTYKEHAARQQLFDKQQIEKLDSLTTFFYRNADAQQIQTPSVNMAMGKKQIVLFLKDIERFFRDKQVRDHRYILCTAPVSLQGEFIADAAPVNSRLKFILLLSLIGWLAGCLAAYLLEQRTAIVAFLRSKPS